MADFQGGVQYDAKGPYVLNPQTGAKVYLSPDAMHTGHAPTDHGPFSTTPYWNQDSGDYQTDLDPARIGDLAAGALLTGGAASAFAGGGGAAAGAGGSAAADTGAGVDGVITSAAGAAPSLGAGAAGAAGTAATTAASGGTGKAIAMLAAKLGIPLGTYLATSKAPSDPSSQISSLMAAFPQLKQLLDMQVSSAKQSVPLQQAVQQMSLNLLPKSSRAAYPGVPNVRGL